MQLEEEAGRMPAWQPVQQLSLQEEGEVADGGDITSQLLPGETAEEDILQGLLDDERAGTGGGAEAAGEAGTERDKQQRAEGQQQMEEGQQEQQQQGPEAAALQDQQQLQSAGAGDTAMLEDGLSHMLTEASAGSELLPGEAGADTATGGSSGPERALLASHSLYRLVLKAPALEVHLHAKVYYHYPLCPPVFNVTKMLDTSSRSDPVPLVDVNEGLKLQEQVSHRRLPMQMHVQLAFDIARMW